jgi:hypothetical protein
LEISVNALLNRYATPLTLGLFAVSTISGIALFFHLAPRAFHGMHEWLSMVLLVPFALHVWKNWGPLLGYMHRGTLVLPVGAMLLAGAAFAVPSLVGSAGGGGPPQMRAVQLLTQARLADLAPVLKTTPEGLQASLAQRGYSVDSTEQTLSAMAASSGLAPESVLFDLMSER